MYENILFYISIFSIMFKKYVLMNIIIKILTKCILFCVHVPDRSWILQSKSYHENECIYNYCTGWKSGDGEGGVCSH